MDAPVYKYHEDQWTFKDGKRTVDYVLVWSEKSKRATSKRAAKMRDHFEANLMDEGLELEQEYVPNTQLHFTKLHAPLDVLLRYAEITKFRMPIKDELNKLVDGLDPKYKSRTTIFDIICPCIKCFDVKEGVFENCVPELTCSYSRARHFLFDVDDPDFFTPAQKARVCQFILFRTLYEEDGEVDMFKFGINRLLLSQVYAAAYPLHDDDFDNPQSMRYRLYFYWATFNNFYKKQPSDHIRQYFGVRTALYFTWLGFYVQMLVPAALTGVMCFIVSLYLLPSAFELEEVCDGSIKDAICPKCDKYCGFQHVTDSCFRLKLLYLFDNYTTIFFATFISLWATIFLALWKRYAAEITLRWDLTGFDDIDENPRPEYAAKLAQLAAENKVEHKVNFITNATEPKVNFWRYMFPGKVLSYSTMLLLIVMALAAVIGVTLYHMFMRSFLPIISSPTATCLNLACILIFSPIYAKLALVLTELELPRTQVEFDGSLTVKMYVLEFINNYSSLFYIAFFKGKFVGPPSGYYRIFGVRQLECEMGGCMWQLTQQLAIIMIGKRIFRSVLQLVKPFCTAAIRKRTSRVGDSRDPIEIGQWEKDYYLDEMRNPLLCDEYIDMVLQYGFATIFVSAFPLAPLFALINNIFEIRTDAQKYLVYFRRPTMRRTKDIGVWFNILQYISGLAVFTNGFIVAFTSTVIPKLVYSLVVSEDLTTRGFMNYSLSYMAIKDLDMEGMPETKLEYCRAELDDIRSIHLLRYFDYREPPWSPEKYDGTKMFWTVLAVRLLFFIFFENIVLAAVVFLKWVIPEVSTNVKWQMRRRHYLINEMIINHELSLMGRHGTRIEKNPNTKTSYI